ncbi:hypothetical protein ACFL6O_05140 [candidate division KSB1 bacterium]
MQGLYIHNPQVSYFKSDYTMKEIADSVEVHYSTIGRIIRKTEKV